MAEPLSAVASGAGLVSLTVQLAETAQKLRKFRNTYKNAETRLEHIAFQIETISIAWRRIDAHRFRYDDWNDELLRRSLLICRQNTEAITEVTTKLETLSEKWKPLYKAGFAIKSSDLDSLLERLDQSLNAMQMAWAIYAESARRQDAVRQEAALTAIYDSVQASVRQGCEIRNDITIIDRHAQMGLSAPRNVTSRPDTIEEEAQSRRRRPTKRQSRNSTRHYKIRLPSWLSNQIWHFAATSAQTGWHLTLTTTRMVPEDAKIWEACYSGDLEIVESLFASGQASILDRRPDIFNAPLVLAAWKGHLDLCRYLLKIGRTVDHWHYNTVESSHRLSCCAEKPAPGLITLLLEALVEDTDFDLAMEEVEVRDGFYWTRHIPEHHFDSIKGYSIPAFHDWPLDQRLNFVGPPRAGQSPEQYLDMCEIPGSARDIAQAGMSCGLLLFLALQGCGKTNDSLQLSWVRFALRLHLLGAELYRDENPSPLHYLVTNSPAEGSSVSKDIQAKVKLLRSWVEERYRLGHNIADYGRAETGRWKAWQGRHKPPSGHAVVGVVYGSSPDEWFLMVQNCVSIHRWQLQSLPGAWPAHKTLPSIICWRPGELETSEGSWRKLDTTDIRSEIRQAGLEKLDLDPPSNAMTALISSTQDDTSILSLLNGKSSTHDSGIRSCSQPPDHKFLEARRHIDRREHVPSHTFCLRRFRRTNICHLDGACRDVSDYHESLRRCAQGHEHIWRFEVRYHINRNTKKAKVDYKRGRQRERKS